MVAPGQKLRKHTDEFKRAAIARSPAETFTAIGKDINVSPSLIASWKRKMEGKQGPLTKRKYTDDFKRAAVARIAAGESPSKLKIELGVTSGMLSNWQKAFKGKKGSKLIKAEKRPYNRQVPPAAVTNGSGPPNKAVMSSIALLRQVKGQINVSDPVHLTAMLVLQTLEGKM